MTKRSSPGVSCRGRRGRMREGYKVIALLLKPSLGLFGLVGRRRVLLPHPGSATGHPISPVDYHTLQHIQVHFGVDLKDVRWHDVALTWNHTKDHNRSRKLCFHHPGHVPVIRSNTDLHFEGAGHDLVVMTWIGRNHELYSSVSPISLVEHCVTFRHDRRLLSIFTNHSARGGYDTSSIFKWSLTGLNSEFSFSQISCLNKAEETSLSYYLLMAGGRIIGFIPFLRVLVRCEMQLARSRKEGSYRSWDLYTTGQLVDGLLQKKKTGFHSTEMESCRLFYGDNFIVPPCNVIIGFVSITTKPIFAILLSIFAPI